MKFKLLLAAVAAASAMGAASGASAQVLNFDDFKGTFNSVPSDYHGYTWTYWEVFNGAGYYNQQLGPVIEGTNGYTNGVVSSPNVACGCANDFQASTSIISGPSIGLNSGYFTSAWNDGETLTVNGYSGANLVDTASFTISTETPSFEMFGWSGLTEITFTPSGGTPQGYNGNGEYFAVDNLSLSGAVPEPAAWGMMLVGFFGLGGAMRAARSRRSAVAA